MQAQEDRETEMTAPPQSTEETLRRELDELRAQNRELLETVDAIRRGEVDAIVVAEDEKPRVYSLDGAERPYRVLVEKIQEGALTLSGSGIILYANAAFARMLNLSLSAVLGTLLAEHVAARDRERLDALLADACTAAGRGELSICSGTGTVPVALSLTPIEADGGTTIGVVVTDRRRDYDRLRLQGRMLDSVVDAVTAVDSNGTIIYWNAAAERLYGWTAAEIVGRRVEDTFDSGVSKGDAQRYFEQLMTGEVWSGEHSARHRDGHRFPIQATQAPVYDEGGTLLAIIGTSRDITEQKRTEKALRESEERFRLALRNAPTAIFHQDADLRYTWYSNPHPPFSNADLVGKTDTDVMSPEDAAPIMALKQEVLATGEARRGEVSVTVDGATTYYDLAIEPVRDADGQTAGVMGVSHDITEQKQAEAALREYAQNLRRSNEDLERFAYVSSHDLQEPLRAIVSFSQLLERRYRGQLDADADEYIDFIVDGGTRMQSLILDLLAYSRVNTTKQVLTPTSTDDVLAAVERNLAPQLNEAGATIAYSPMPTVIADPLQLEQVFMNLISNAIKFRRPDVPLRVQIGARRIDRFWEFWVADNGIGIDPQYNDQIFVIFQRLHTKDAYPGTGIGLAIVKRIIDRHGGQIGVESVPGEGSTFFFTLPAA